jgi:hypothetical protein
MNCLWSVSEICYDDFAEKIVAAVGKREYFSGVFYSHTPDVSYRLELSIAIYRDQKSGEVVDVAFVWWDCTTIVEDEDGGECFMPNDFDIDRLYELLV